MHANVQPAPASREPLSQADEALQRARAFDAYRGIYQEHRKERTHAIRLLDSPGATLTVTCPEWCQTDHQEDVTHGTFLEDFAHRGTEEALHVDLGDGTHEDVLLCEITQHPFGRDMRLPVALLWPTLGMTQGLLDGRGLRRLADQLRTYAESLDDLAVDVDQAREQAPARHRADHEGRGSR